MRMVKVAVDSVYTNGTGQTDDTAKCCVKVLKGEVHANLSCMFHLTTSGDDVADHNSAAIWLTGTEQCTWVGSENNIKITNTTDTNQTLSYLLDNNTNVDTIYHAKSDIVEFYGVQATGNNIKIVHGKDINHEISLSTFNTATVGTDVLYPAYIDGATSAGKIVMINSTFEYRDVNEDFIGYEIGSGSIVISNCYYDTVNIPSFWGNVTYDVTNSNGVRYLNELNISRRVSINTDWSPAFDITNTNAQSMIEFRLAPNMGQTRAFKFQVAGSSYAGSNFIKDWSNTPIVEPLATAMYQVADNPVYFGTGGKAYMKMDSINGAQLTHQPFGTNDLSIATVKTVADASVYDYKVTANDWADFRDAHEGGLYANIYTPDGTYTCTDNEASPLVIHANVKRMDGQSMAGTIINANCAVNTSITTMMRFSSYDTVCSNIQIQNLANSSYGFWGETSSLTSDSKNKTQLINCRVYGITFPAVGFRNINAINCEAENPSSVGSLGAGKGFWICNNLIGCHTTYVSWGFSASEGMTNCSAAKFTEGFNGNNIDGCHAKGGTTAFSACTNLSYNNTASNVTNDYVSCSFNSTYRDNTDNTKELTHDYSSITTSTEREVAWQDKSGTVALLSDISSVSHNTLTGLNTGDYQHLTADELSALQAKASAYAYLNSSSSVTCTVSGTYYPIAGTFTNDFVNFIFDTDHIEYTGTLTQKFEIDWHASLSAESNGTTVHVTVAKNGTNQTAQRMGVYCKTAGETFTVSGTIVLELEEDDEIQLVVSSDDAGGDITFAHFTTTIARFLR